jgi:hypothetical protein
MQIDEKHYCLAPSYVDDLPMTVLQLQEEVVEQDLLAVSTGYLQLLNWQIEYAFGMVQW